MKSLLVALALGMMALPAHALDRAEYLGSVRLSRTGGVKSFRTPACRPGERTDAFRITVRNQPAYIDQVGLQFRNGQTQYFRVQQNFPANSRTRWVDLRGNGRCIAAVQISGQSLNLLQKATVDIEGRVMNNNGGGWPGGGNGGGWPGDDDGDDDGYDDDYGN